MSKERRGIVFQKQGGMYGKMLGDDGGHGSLGKLKVAQLACRMGKDKTQD